MAVTVRREVTETGYVVHVEGPLHRHGSSGFFAGVEVAKWVKEVGMSRAKRVASGSRFFYQNGTPWFRESVSYVMQ